MGSSEDRERSSTEAETLLLEDYRYLADSFWKNEQTGETRVHLFIGFVTLVAGGLVSLATAEHGPKGETLRLIVLASLFSLLVLGLITMMRMLIRNKNTDGYKRGLDTIRQVFKDYFDDTHVLVHYYPVEVPEIKERPSDFREDEFVNHLSVKSMCEVINRDGYVIKIKGSPDSIKWLNNVLKVDDFYDQVVNKKTVKQPSDFIQNRRAIYRRTHRIEDLMTLNRCLLEEFYPQETPKKDVSREKRTQKERWWEQYKKETGIRKFGGLAHTVAAINSLIFAGISGTFVYPFGAGTETAKNLWWVSGLAVAVFIIAFGALLACITFGEIRGKAKLRAGATTHAGGLVYKFDKDIVKYLIVKPRDNSDKWVLPKGHIYIEEGEGHGEAALREVREETGVIARIIGLIDSVEFKVDGEDVKSKFYLMECLYEDEDKQSENRKKDWVPFNDAINELTFADSKYILREAEKKIAAMAVVKP